jgi:hypothetical protein
VIAFLVCLLTAVNPLFLVYAQYVCSDVPYMIFCALAIILHIYGKTSKEAVFSAVFMGCSLATKLITLIPEIYLSIVFTGVIIAVLLFVANFLYDMLQSDDSTIKHLFIFIIFPLLMMSLTRVANRYVLIILVPLALYSAKRILALSQRNSKKLLGGIVIVHTLCFLVIGIYSNYYLMLRGMAH